MPAYRIQSDIFGLEWKLDRIGYRRHIVSVACENLQHTKLKTHSFKLTVVSICHDFIPGFQWGSCYSIFSFMCRSFFVFCPFSFGHCVVCPLIYGFWLPLWYLLAIVLSVLLWFTASDYQFGIFKLFYQCGIFYFGHCVACPSLIYSFRLLLWYPKTLLLMWHFC